MTTIQINELAKQNNCRWKMGGRGHMNIKDATKGEGIIKPAKNIWCNKDKPLTESVKLY